MKHQVTYQKWIRRHQVLINENMKCNLEHVKEVILVQSIAKSIRKVLASWRMLLTGRPNLDNCAILALR